MDILKRIDELREEKGWSVRQLAAQAGLKQSTLQNLYDRNNTPTFPTLEKICSAFGISFAEFFSVSTDKVYTSEQINILEQWDKLSTAQKKSILPELIERI